MNKAFFLVPVALGAGILMGMSIHGHNDALKAERNRPTSNGEVVYVIDVHDGDTFSFVMDGVPKELNPLKIRLRGIDTPEIGGKAKCKSEEEAAERARDFTMHLIAQGDNRVRLVNMKWDKYGGRIDADVFVGKDFSHPLTQALIQGGFGREYHGEARTKGWCGTQRPS